ncbi:MAG: HlyD family efflux transporter periplasmic adaptor subunit [Gammaproteobacteria bacterium]|nr:HlyD family efflux transporter periplasmic adaptor subunit [Gammaproteobacteria bacterium]MDD9894351.1 HlyD family efflux transporter periplasmic adaptor subunit [Gammaproteobacteria bacterium]MDD9957671.1 HlyD family efflux transporter periplasmic adaptor subunit [Gammaproteobacteria bacterium]
MTSKRYKVYFSILLSSLLVACEEPAQMAVGQLESDRVEIVAESNEPIVSIPVLEGDVLNQGGIILRQDTNRIDIRIQEADANIERIQAILDEQIAGPRPETIDAMQANLLEANIERDFRARELNRLTGLREQNLTSIESIDTAQMLLARAEARINLFTAQLAELQAGTREEQIAQTRHQLQQASAQLNSLRFDRERLFVIATASGLVDSLPFEVGERPRVGDVVAVLLTGSQPYARVYIPEPMRVGINIGSELLVHIDGIENPLAGTVRRIASESSFTPYFALTERDRSRLSYMAEIALPDTTSRLPEGVPVQVYFDSP